MKSLTGTQSPPIKITRRTSGKKAKTGKGQDFHTFPFLLRSSDTKESGASEVFSMALQLYAHQDRKQVKEGEVFRRRDREMERDFEIIREGEALKKDGLYF